MAEEEPSPRPFRRERNLSNRNFNKRSSNRRRFSTESHSSAETKVLANANNPEVEEDTSSSVSVTSSVNTDPSLSGTSSSMNITYSVNTDTENAFNQKSLLKMRTAVDINLTDEQAADVRYSCLNNQSSGKKLQRQTPTTPQTPDPALLGVKEKLILFENLQTDERITFKTTKYKSKSSQSLLQSERSTSLTTPDSVSSTSGSYLVQAYPMGNSNIKLEGIRNSAFSFSIDEEHSEDEVDSIKDEVNEEEEQGEEELELENPTNQKDEFGRCESIVSSQSLPVSAINKSFLTPVFQHSNSQPEEFKTPKDKHENNNNQAENATQNTRKKDFPRNFRSRPKTEIIETTTELRPRQTDKFNSLHHKPKQSEPDDEEQIELRDKGYSFIRPILEELIKTEESYVENLWIGINNYGNIFERSDLPVGLRGKKFVLFGNVEQIAEFHRDEFLPMLQRNRHDLKRIFDEFQQYIDNNYFYGYVLFTMNKQRSLKLCDVYKNYFKLLQNEIDDKLGINSFLVQPIQRMARYPLLLQQFITTLFKNRDYVMKPVIESCCRLEKKLRNLLITTNESEVINDIVCINEANEFNTFYQGKFRKVSEFHVIDHTLKRNYRSKVFIFDKCIIYTEIKGKQLIFHGRYPCEHIGITAKIKQFTLYYDQRKQQECDFIGEPALIEQWLELIRDMITAYAAEERRKLKELHSNEFGGDHMHRKPANLSLFRDSNRFSSDSGIGNIWIVPKPEQEEASNNRTTWYAVS